MTGPLLAPLLACLALAAPPFVPASAPVQDADAPEARELPPVEAPPELSPAKAAALDRAIKLLRNSKAEPRARSEAKVIEFGRGAIPALLEAATTEHEGMQDGLFACLIDLADLRDRELIAEALASERVVHRRFAANRAGALKLFALLDRVETLLGDADTDVRSEAALALIANGREAGLDRAVLIFDDPDWHPRVLAALPGVAGHGDHAPVAARLAIDPRREKEEPDETAKERLAAVQLLHAIGDDPAIALLLRALDDKHNVVQREAIDALRHLVEQQGPLQASSIFQQINEVKRLKEVVAARR